jgi:hypothetical protein
MREKLAKAHLDRWIARLATRQHGVVSVPQFLAAGLTYEGIRRRVRMGRLHRIHRGVYAVGHKNLSHQGWWMAAVLACGEGRDSQPSQGRHALGNAEAGERGG